nr:PieR [Streptomyces conglobatus]
MSFVVGLQISVLGPLTVWRDGHPVELGPARQRKVLAALLLSPGQAIEPDQLKEMVWPHRPPSAAMASLHSYMSNLRRALEPDRPPRSRNQLLRREPSGYLLAVAPEAVDAYRFERLFRDGRRLLQQGEHDKAGRVLRECLDLWRGSPYPEVCDDAFGAQTSARLEELRLLALESRWEAELARSQDTSLIAADLTSLSMKFPTRERLRWLQMQALYRAGRQAEALKAYHQTRTLLADEYGIDPGPDLQRLFGSILRGGSGVVVPQPS